ncbi:unnamed protein product [Staurois parvus]|uniref:Uncharacterized protein n=1 Tax=Staurois parvus TaxID=386267 RepID=A0ABN9E8H1_9NEOB|nr:unnamed protein product [Staurois parvus]
MPAHQCRLSIPPISASYQCPLVLPIHATSSVPISAAYQCSLITANQCPSVLPICAQQCCQSVPICTASQ